MGWTSHLLVLQRRRQVNWRCCICRKRKSKQAMSASEKAHAIINLSIALMAIAVFVGWKLATIVSIITATMFQSTLNFILNTLMFRIRKISIEAAASVLTEFFLRINQTFNVSCAVSKYASRCSRFGKIAVYTTNRISIALLPYALCINVYYMIKFAVSIYRHQSHLSTWLFICTAILFIFGCIFCYATYFTFNSSDEQYAGDAVPHDSDDDDDLAFNQDYMQVWVQSVGVGGGKSTDKAEADGISFLHRLHAHELRYITTAVAAKSEITCNICKNLIVEFHWSCDECSASNEMYNICQLCFLNDYKSAKFKEEAEFITCLQLNSLWFCVDGKSRQLRLTRNNEEAEDFTVRLLPSDDTGINQIYISMQSESSRLVLNPSKDNTLLLVPANNAQDQYKDFRLSAFEIKPNQFLLMDQTSNYLYQPKSTNTLQMVCTTAFSVRIYT